MNDTNKMDKGAKWTVGAVVASTVVIVAVVAGGFKGLQPRTIVEKQVVYVTPTATPSAALAPVGLKKASTKVVEPTASSASGVKK